MSYLVIDSPVNPFSPDADIEAWIAVLEKQAADAPDEHQPTYAKAISQAQDDLADRRAAMADAAERAARFNENHDPSNGQFASGDGGGVATASGQTIDIAKKDTGLPDESGVRYEPLVNAVAADLAPMGISGEVRARVVPDIGGKTNVNIDIDTPPGTSPKIAFSATVILNGNKGTAFVEDVNVRPEYQGKGAARAFMGHLAQSAKKAGYDRIGLDAVAAGAYAWARLGFTPTQKSWDDMKAAVGMPESTDPRDIWKVADSSNGKARLKGQGWTGTLNLRDKVAMERFNSYVHPAGRADEVTAAANADEMLDMGAAIYADCFDGDGNPRAARFNENHDPSNGQFTTGDGGGSAPGVDAPHASSSSTPVSSEHTHTPKAVADFAQQWADDRKATFYDASRVRTKAKADQILGAYAAKVAAARAEIESKVPTSGPSRIIANDDALRVMTLATEAETVDDARRTIPVDKQWRTSLTSWNDKPSVSLTDKGHTKTNDVGMISRESYGTYAEAWSASDIADVRTAVAALPKFNGVDNTVLLLPTQRFSSGGEFFTEPGSKRGLCVVYQTYGDEADMNGVHVALHEYGHGVDAAMGRAYNEKAKADWAASGQPEWSMPHGLGYDAKDRDFKAIVGDRASQFKASHSHWGGAGELFAEDFADSYGGGHAFFSGAKYAEHYGNVQPMTDEQKHKLRNWIIGTLGTHA